MQHDAHVKAHIRRVASIERNRARRRAQAAIEGREVRSWVHLSDEERPARRNVLRRTRRASIANLPPLHDAHVCTRREQLARFWGVPCNAHVWAWRKACPGPAWLHRYRTDAAFNQKERDRTKARRAAAADDMRLGQDLAWNVKRGVWPESWATVLGYGIDELVAHLRKTLPGRATWDAFLTGDLRIDLIVPRGCFDLADRSQVRECWSLSNLRLLRRRDKIAKAARQEHLL